MMTTDDLPLEYRCDEARRRIHVVARRPFTLLDAAAVLQRQIADGAWGYAVLVDLRAGRLSFDDKRVLLQQVTYLSHQHGRRGPVALVILDVKALGDYVVASARLGHTVKMFRFAYQAEQWLDEHENLRH